jgi:lipoyl(octanoyl) transferase
MFIARDFKNLQPYEAIFEAMQRQTLARTTESFDEIWLLEHSPVFTQGMAGKKEHVLNPHTIPVIQTDRGGQVTYHGPGQLILYALIDLRRKKIAIRNFVTQLETTVIHLLAMYGIQSNSKTDAPGIYIHDAKICSIGLKVKHGCSYHGIALNIDMDLTPFTFINPCGFKQLQMTQIKHFKPSVTLSQVKKDIITSFMRVFNYNQYELRTSL